MKIIEVKARKILNSRNEDTIEITVNGKFKGSAPGGASVGKHEVAAFPKTGVDIPVRFVNRVLNKNLNGFIIESFGDLRAVESLIKEYDKTKDLSKVGGDIVIALEYALLKALANGEENVWNFLNPNARKIPMPLGNCVGGGVHFKGNRFKGEKLDIQEFLVLPKTEKFSDAMLANYYIYRIMRDKLKTNRRTDEEALAPEISDMQVLEMLKNAVELAERKLGFEIKIGMDFAASQFWDGINYKYENFSQDKKEKNLLRKEQIEFVEKLIKKYNVAYIEDPLDEEDFLGFSKIKKDKALICGDDLICTNLERLKQAVNSINAVIIKPNQVGSLIETKKVVDFAKQNNIIPVISHRSGETMDKTIAHLAVAWEIPIVKFGIIGKERLAKLNELKKIEKLIFSA